MIKQENNPERKAELVNKLMMLNPGPDDGLEQEPDASKVEESKKKVGVEAQGNLARIHLSPYIL